MKKKFLYFLNKELLFKLLIFIIILAHGTIFLKHEATLFKYDIIEFEKDKQCTRKYIVDDEQISNEKSDIVFKDEQNVFIIYDDHCHGFKTFHSMLQEKI